MLRTTDAKLGVIFQMRSQRERKCGIELQYIWDQCVVGVRCISGDNFEISSYDFGVSESRNEFLTFVKQKQLLCYKRIVFLELNRDAIAFQQFIKCLPNVSSVHCERFDITNSVKIERFHKTYTLDDLFKPDY